MTLDIFGRNIIQFVVLIVLQVLIINNINIGAWGITPFFFILFILLLPFNTPNWVLIVTAFLLGIVVDVFSDTLGLNASAAVMMAFARPLVLNAISLRETYDTAMYPKVHYFGLEWFLKYSLSLTFIHQLMYYLVDAWSFSAIFIVLMKAILGTLITTIFIVLSQFLIFRK